MPLPKIALPPALRFWRCVYCDKVLNRSTRTRDHFIPKSHGGKGGKNLVDCCKECNQAKGDMIFESVQDVRAYFEGIKALKDRYVVPPPRKK